MCGVAGILSARSSAQEKQALLKKMTAKLAHRGPDGEGYYAEGPIGLGHTRLSIIDLQGGDQPIHNEDQSVWVVFNGEIFNFVELTDKLKAQGHRFYTKSDTEVIVHLYEQYGEDFPKYLNGQFAIALWDSNKGSLLLVRDRFGIVPLFYQTTSLGLTFASEAKALMAVAPSAPVLDPMVLDEIFTFWSPAGNHSIFKGVSQVEPGTMLVFDVALNSKQSTYWEWQFPQQRLGEAYIEDTKTCVSEEVLDLLDTSVQLRLRSDVPVGAYLSGGLDSSIVTALIHKSSPDRLRTFSLGFSEASFDESSYQQAMIEHLDTRHSSIQCRSTDIAENFLRTIWHTESPILRTAPVPMSMLSGLVRSNGYKVVLTGEGADEVFGGYDIFKELKIREFWAKNPSSKWRSLMLKRLYPYLDLTTAANQRYVKNFFGANLEDSGTAFFAHQLRWSTTAKAKHFYSAEMKDAVNRSALDRLHENLPKDYQHWSSFNQTQFLEAKLLMGSYLLCSQGDRMLTSNSVEGRFPFLDHHVVDYANRLSPTAKMKVLREKHVLKEATAHLLPSNIIDRYKQPYRAPDATAFSGDSSACPMVDELMSSAKVADYGYFEPKRVEMLLKKAKAGKISSTKDSQSFVGILSTQALHYLYIDNFSESGVVTNSLANSSKISE